MCSLQASRTSTLCSSFASQLQPPRILNASAGTWTLKRIREGRPRLSVVPLGPVRPDVGAVLILQTEMVLAGFLSFDLPGQKRGHRLVGGCRGIEVPR